MINLFDTIQNYVTGGTWLTGKCDGTSTNTLDISDPTNVDTSPITVTGEYWFNYTTTNSPSGCDGCTEVKINILANDYTVGVAEDIDVCSSNLNPYDLETDIYNWTNPPTLDDIVPQWDLFVIFPSSDCAVLNQFGSNLVGSNIQSNITQVDDLNISSCSAGNTINAILRGRYVFPDGNSCVKEVNFNVNIEDCVPCPELTVTTPILLSNGNTITFPFSSTPFQFDDFRYDFQLTPNNCTDLLSLSDMIRVRFNYYNHDLSGGNASSNGFIVTIGDGTSGAQYITESITIEPNTPSYGTDTAWVVRLSQPAIADRWVEFDIPLGELLNGQYLSTFAYGSVQNGVEIIDNIDVEIMTDICNC